MTNVQTEIKSGKLIITIDISDKVVKAAKPSSSGKNKVVASTHGFVRVGENGLSMGLNVISK